MLNSESSAPDAFVTFVPSAGICENSHDFCAPDLANSHDIIGTYSQLPPSQEDIYATERCSFQIWKNITAYNDNIDIQQ